MSPAQDLAVEKDIADPVLSVDSLGRYVRKLNVAFGGYDRPDAAAVDIGDPEVSDQGFDIDDGGAGNAYLKIDVANVAALIFLYQVHNDGPAQALRNERRRWSLHVG